MKNLNNKVTDHNREWLTFAKIIHIFNILFSKNTTVVLESVKKF